MSVEDDEVAEVRSLWHLGIHMDGGQRYLAALQKLGLDPECLFWAEDEAIGHPVLVLVTEQFDRVGPLELSRTLFKAYDNAGTPREINPFILRLHSPAQTLIQDIEKIDAVRNGSDVHLLARSASADVFISMDGLRFKLSWIYKWSVPRKSPDVNDLRRRWRSFAANVDRLAA